MQINRVLLAAGAAASLGLTGCGFLGGQSVDEGSASAEPLTAADRAPVEQAVTDSASTAYTPSYGLRRKFSYQYHPELEIYYSPESGSYFWMDGDAWVSGQSLPGWQDDFEFSETVKITLNTDQPYTRHEYVIRAHPGYVRASGQAQPAFTGVETDR